MAPKTKKGPSAPSKNKFAETLLKIGCRFSLPQVFDDFITMAIAACTQNPQTKLSHYEDEYLQTIAPYKESELRYEFPKAFAYLVMEMEECVNSELGNDVLGEFFEQHISHGRNGQYFTPHTICEFMALITHTDREYDEEADKNRSLRIVDPSCGSGRMLLAAFKRNGTGHEYYGIDIDRTCVKMTALNLFLNGVWHSEVLCANALVPGDFVIAYHISLLPFGIFKIQEKERSILWHLQTNSFKKDAPTDQKPFTKPPEETGTQLNLF